MNEYLEDLAQMNLFSGIEPGEIAKLLNCLQARRIQYASGEMILEEGSRVRKFGIILSGHARSIKWDTSGRVIILTLLERGVKSVYFWLHSRKRKALFPYSAGRCFRADDPV